VGKEAFMFVTDSAGPCSKFFGRFCFVLAIVAGSGCSSEDRPAVVSTNSDSGSDGQGGSTTTTTTSTGGTDGDGASEADVAGWAATCRALTPPAPECPCICRECAEVTARCFASPDCPPILECVQRTGCRSNVECIGPCGAEIAVHMPGIFLAQNFRACFNPNCSAVCVLPDASTVSSDGAQPTTTDASISASSDASTSNDKDGAPADDVSSDGADGF
jgi:hypothetical protein